MVRVEKCVLGMCATNCYAIYDTGVTLPGAGKAAGEVKDAIIVDPAADVYAIKDMIERLAIRPVAILLTHGHFDHFLAAEALSRMYDIKIYVSCEEKDILTNETYNLSLPFTGTGTTLDADEYFNTGDILYIAGFKIRTISVPGHTKGGTCYYFEKEKILLSGDTLFAGSVGRSDFPTGSMSTLIRAIKEGLFSLPGDVRVYPGHGESTTIDFEKINNPFF